MESRDSEDMPFASLERHLADIGPWKVPKSAHVTIMKIEDLQIDTRRRIHWFQKKYYSVRSMTKNNEVVAVFRTVASLGACGRLAVLNWRYRRQYMFLVKF